MDFLTIRNAPSISNVPVILGQLSVESLGDFIAFVLLTEPIEGLDAVHIYSRELNVT